MASKNAQLPISSDDHGVLWSQLPCPAGTWMHPQTLRILWSKRINYSQNDHQKELWLYSQADVRKLLRIQAEMTAELGMTLAGVWKSAIRAWKQLSKNKWQNVHKLMEQKQKNSALKWKKNLEQLRRSFELQKRSTSVVEPLMVRD